MTAAPQGGVVTATLARAGIERMGTEPATLARAGKTDWNGENGLERSPPYGGMEGRKKHER